VLGDRVIVVVWLVGQARVARELVSHDAPRCLEDDTPPGAWLSVNNNTPRVTRYVAAPGHAGATSNVLLSLSMSDALRAKYDQ
jgi:hypothetical protein